MASSNELVLQNIW